MIRFTGKAALALVHVVSGVFVVSSRDGCAQMRVVGQGQSLAALGAAIAEARRSPFRPADPTDLATAPRTARVTTVPTPAGELLVALRETGRHPAADEVSLGEMFAVTASAALLTDYLGVVLAGKDNLLPGGGRFSFLRASGGLAVGALGPALGGGVLTEKFGTAAVGSVLGSGVALVAVLPFAESGAPRSVLLLSYALIHGGITMVSVTR